MRSTRSRVLLVMDSTKCRPYSHAMIAAEARELVREWTRANRYTITAHARDRMRQRRVSEEDLVRALSYATGCKADGDKWKATGPDLDGDDLTAVWFSRTGWSWSRCSDPGKESDMGHKLRKCVKCGHRELVDARARDSVVVAGHTFAGVVPAQRCTRCGEVYFLPGALGRLELLAAHRLAAAGERAGEAVKFMRKALGMRAIDLAELLDVTPDTVSRWETDKSPIGRGELALLGALVDDRIAGHTSTLDRLQGLRKPARLGRRVKLEVVDTGGQ